MKLIDFNIPLVTGKEEKYLGEVFQNGKFSGDGPFTIKCNDWFLKMYPDTKTLLTTSCTHALEMAALLIDIQPDDEVIMPSYTFVSTANAFVLRGAKIIFVDVRPDTMNIDEKLIESAITEKTKAIVPVHYAGVSCEMDTIMEIARKHNLYVIEDAAQGMMSSYKGKALGTIGHIGCFSFHETKNYQCGEGGALLVNEEQFFERAEFIREKGTNRSKFFRGKIDKYSWVDMGSSYLPSELNAAFLLAQLEHAEVVNQDRLKSWKLYYSLFTNLVEKKKIEIAFIPDECEHNAHMFYIKTKDLQERSALIAYLKKNGVDSVFHYVPLHSAIAGKKYGKFHKEDEYTTVHSDKLVRLPMIYQLKDEDIHTVVKTIEKFYN